jgi:2-C-methyl-D-erythritol 4-phosphate cytidylyltransferase
MASVLIVAAAGTGVRLGREEPKALVSLMGRPLLSWVLDSLSGLPFDATVVTAPPDRVGDFEALVRGRGQVVAGGETRAASVRRAFERAGALPRDVVCIHDAARPLVSPAEVREVIAAAERSGAAIAACPIVDTVKRVEDHRIVSTVDRNGLWAAGTPQAFRADLLRQAFAAGREATDEAALCEAAGIPVAIVPVSRAGFKITGPEDLELAEALVKARGGKAFS